MSDEQPTSWRDRFFGSSPAADRTAPTNDEQVDEQPERAYDSAEVAPDEAEVAAVSVEDHDEHQPLVEHDAAADSVGSRDDDAAIEPTVIAPSTLRGPSHSAAHPDDARESTDGDHGTGDAGRARADEAHGEAAGSSLEQPTEADAAADPAVDGEPPALVEPRRPSFGLRRRGDADGGDALDSTDADAAAGGAAAGAAGTAAVGSASSPEFSEPAPTQAMEAQQARDEQATQVLDTTGRDDATATRALDAQPEGERTERFGIIRDEVHPSSIPVDDETARAAASGGTPIVLVEEPMPPRRKGARGVGFAVALLATLVFAIVFAAAFFAVEFLFNVDFGPAALLESVWLLPSYLLPVIVFFLAYWIITLVVNRAGWWAHVLGAFIVALLVYAAHIVGAYMEQQGGWAGYTEVFGIDGPSLGQLLLAPLSVLAFVVAREVPIWVGGIVSRRGRKAREWNRQSMEDFNRENDERLANYERARA